MEIHYIFIAGFKHFRQVGINLSSRFIFEMQVPEETTAPFILTVKENPEYIKNFLGYDNVENVTAIIGQNGAGKTTILNYIRSMLPRGRQANIINDILVFSTNEEGDLRFYLAHPTFLELKFENLTRTEFKKVKYNSDFKFSDLPFQVKNAHYIFYSYFPHYKEDYLLWDGLSNISTSDLLGRERRNMDEEFHNHKQDLRKLYKPDLDYLHQSEVLRALNFLIHNPQFELPFDRPQELAVEVDYSDFSFFTSENTDSNSLEIIKQLEELLKLSSDPRKKFLDNLLFSILINYLIDERKYTTSSIYIHTLRPVSGDDNVSDYVLEYFVRMDGMEIITSQGNATSDKHDNLGRLVPAMVNLVERLVNDGVLRIRTHNLAGIMLGKEADELFTSLVNLYNSIRGISHFLRFSWRGLSGGEQSFLSFMSRFYEVAVGMSEYATDIVILIDEGDAAFHPDWQRKFFKDSIEFLSRAFTPHRLQIIYTANTPFITSDLTKPHIVFIEKDEVTKLSRIENKINDREHTFAANIHTLFSDSFYMKGILMGEFAKDKIKGIFNHLKNGEPESAEYRQLISMIGEPVLRHKLESLWKEQYGEDEEIALLEKRLEELRANKKKNKS